MLKKQKSRGIINRMLYFHGGGIVMKRKLYVFAVLSLTVISFVGCSGDDDSYSTTDSSYESSNYEDDNSDSDDSGSSSSSSHNSDSSNSSSSYSGSSSKTIEHYCEADGCYKEGTESIVGLNNTLEYYCYTHYKEMEDMVNDMVEGTYSSSSSFTNKTGTSTTKCAHSGCNNYIASSGDTYYCTTHSKKCGVCGCYIDEDAMYCPTCIIDAFTQ